MREPAELERDERVSTGIEGLDELIEGGLPTRSLVILGGRPGTGKTLLSATFLHEGAIHGEPAIYVSFAESEEQFLSSMRKFGLDFQKLIDRKLFEFIDLTTVASEGVSDALNLIISRISAMKAKRLVIDSFTSIALSFDKTIEARIALHVILGKLVREEGCTTLLLVEMPYGTNRIGLGVEEFVADGIIIMDSVEHKGGPLRTLNVKKMRGTSIRLDTSTYTISSRGITVFGSPTPPPARGVGKNRVATHIPGFDELVEGGLLERSVCTLAGAAGTGKTTFGLQFAYNGAKEEGEKSLFISFGESVDQLEVLSARLGMAGIPQLVKMGVLTLEGITPEGSSIQAIEQRVKSLLSQSGATRVVLDDVTGLQSICTDEEFYVLIKKLILLSKSAGATTVITMTAGDLGAQSVTGMNLSTIVDSIVLLRYVEVEGRMDRSMILLKMRGTRHDTTIKKFSIGEKGIAMQGNFAGYTGVLTGTALRVSGAFEESERRIAAGERISRNKRRADFERRMGAEARRKR